MLVPALAHGTSIGPYDILQNSGLNKVPHVNIHNSTLQDQIRLFIPWTSLVWTQVHQGHLPLWNPYSALGMPLAFNWESAPLSPPVLIGFLFPVRLAYTAQLVVTVVIAGTGVYVLGKVLRLGTLGCMTAAIVFELSGPFIGFLGWPLSSVMSWAGWLFAAIVLILRGDKRARAIVLLAVVIAFAFYAGDPEGVLLLALSAAIFAVVMLLLRAPALGGSGPVIRPAIDLGFRRLQARPLPRRSSCRDFNLRQGSNRTVVGPALFPKGLPPKELVHLIFQGFDGLPLSHSQWFGLSAYEATCRVCRSDSARAGGNGARPALEAAGGALLCLGGGGNGTARVRAPPCVRLGQLRHTHLLDFRLDAIGLCGRRSLRHRDGHFGQVLPGAERPGVRSASDSLRWRYCSGSSGLWPDEDLLHRKQDIRSHSFIWPTIEVIAGLVVVWTLARLTTRTQTRLVPPAVGAGSVAGLLLLLVVTGFLVASGAPLISSSSHYPTSTPEVTALKRAVGNAIVGFGDFACVLFEGGNHDTMPTFSMTFRSSQPTTR